MTNYIEIEKTLLTDGKYISKTRLELEQEYKASFLPNIVPVIGSLPVINNKITDSLKALLKGKGKIDSPIGLLDRGQVAAAIRIVANVPRSKLYNSKDESTRYKGLTPMLMYSLREIQNYKYTYWDKKDINISVLLSKSLYSSIKNAKMPDRDQLIRDRLIHVSSVGDTEWKSAKGLETKGTQLAKLMMLQCWIAHPLIRCVDAQILHPTDWDTIPEPLVNIPSK